MGGLGETLRDLRRRVPKRYREMHEKYREIRRSGIEGVEERYTKMQKI
jgi:hypothetical protein